MDLMTVVSSIHFSSVWHKNLSSIFSLYFSVQLHMLSSSQLQSLSLRWPSVPFSPLLFQLEQFKKGVLFQCCTEEQTTQARHSFRVQSGTCFSAAACMWMCTGVIRWHLRGCFLHFFPALFCAQLRTEVGSTNQLAWGAGPHDALLRLEMCARWFLRNLWLLITLMFMCKVIDMCGRCFYVSMS